MRQIISKQAFFTHMVFRSVITGLSYEAIQSRSDSLAAFRGERSTIVDLVILKCLKLQVDIDSCSGVNY
jgi:hypothetical protein